MASVNESSMDIKEDWNNREKIENLTATLKNIISFLNRFDSSSREKIAQIDQTLNDLEKRVDFMEAQVQFSQKCQRYPLSDEPAITSISKKLKPEENLKQAKLPELFQLQRQVLTKNWPKYATDIVRKAYKVSDNIDEFVSECKRLDFAIGSLNRSNSERIFEVADYLLSIIAHEQLRETQLKFKLTDFIKIGHQDHLTPDMLTTLADWLIDLQDNFSLNHETVHLTWSLLFSYFDKKHHVPRGEIQLMACAAIMIACKLEEHQMPSLDDFIYYTGNAYLREDFLSAEKKLLGAIDFVVHRPNPYIFLRRYARVLDPHNGYVQYLSRFLLEVGMHSYSLSLIRDSKKAAACLWLARVVLKNPSYQDWARRSDVRQVRSSITSNPQACKIYKHALKNRSLKYSMNESLISDRSMNDSDHNISQDSQLNLSGSSLPDTSKGANSLLQRIPSINLSLSSSTIEGSFTSSPIDVVDDSNSGLSAQIKTQIEGLVAEESQIRPYWPPILCRLTGYREKDLIPIALRYHRMAFSLIAEAASASNFNKSTSSESTTRHAKSYANMSVEEQPLDMRIACQTFIDESSNHSTKSVESAGSGASSGCEPQARKHLVVKYCDSSFLGVANVYPQLASENLIPFFPAIQCPDSCQCFICQHLMESNNSKAAK